MSQERRPSAVYTLALVGVVFQGLGLALSIMFLWVPLGVMDFGGMMGGLEGTMGWPIGVNWLYGIGVVWIAIAAVVLGLAVYGLKLVASVDPHNVRQGSIMLLVVSIVAFPTMWGLFIGSLLMFIAGVMGLTWEPPKV